MQFILKLTQMYATVENTHYKENESRVCVGVVVSVISDFTLVCMYVCTYNSARTLLIPDMDKPSLIYILQLIIHAHFRNRMYL